MSRDYAGESVAYLMHTKHVNGHFPVIAAVSSGPPWSEFFWSIIYFYRLDVFFWCYVDNDEALKAVWFNCSCAKECLQM